MINFFRRHVFHNIGLKAVSLACAMLLWLAVARNPAAEVGVTVPLEFYHVPSDLDISSEHTQAQVRVRGPERMLRGLNADTVRVGLDLTGAAPGERTYDLTNQTVQLPKGVELVQIVPSHLRISFDRRISKTVEVRPRVVGTFASGYRIASVTADPAQVQIVGPERRVNAIEAALSDPVDASGVVGQAKFSSHLYVPDPFVHLVRPEPVQITVITEKNPPKH